MPLPTSLNDHVTQVNTGGAAASETWFKACGSLTANQWFATWVAPGWPSAMPTPATGGGAALSGSTQGAMPLPSLTSTQRLWAAHFASVSPSAGSLRLVDLLWANSGLDATLTTSQAVNSVALPRYATGIKVRCSVLVHASLGATARNLTVNYTNSAGVGGFSTSVAIPASSPAGRIYDVPLASNDPGNGFRSIQSVQLDGSTGTAGNFGLVLYEEIGITPIGVDWDSIRAGAQELAQAGGSQPCLAFLFFAGATATYNLNGTLKYGIAAS